jgi:branched-subunit amino acid ABC-type transport system permease component
VKDLLPILVTGLAQGFPLFIIASGLTLIYGVLRVLNFAHGSLFMIGAYVVAVSLKTSDLTSFVLTILLAGLCVAAVGVASELVIFRRMYREDHAISFLGAFALFLTLNGLVEHTWGAEPRTVQYPAAISGPVTLAGATVSKYDLVVIAVGMAIAVALWLLVSKSHLGAQMRAISHDRTMAMALGIRVGLVSTLVFALGAFLAGVAGGLIAPGISVDPSMAGGYIVSAFIVIIVGTMGSVSGAFVAALVLQTLESFIFRYIPWLSGFGFYVAVTVILLLRPQGLFGGRMSSNTVAR